MKQIFAIPLLATILLMPATSKNVNNPFAGRRDFTVTPRVNPQNPPKNPAQLAPYPDWMELVEKNGKFDVRVQPRAGSVRPVRT